MGHDLIRPIDAELDANFTAALDQDFTPIDDVRASRAYRQHMAKNLLIKALLAASSDAPNADMLAGFSDQTKAILETNMGAAE